MTAPLTAGKTVITGQTHGTGMDPTGKAGTGWTVKFTTAGGQPGDVFVPDTAYNTAGVHAAVRKLAATMDEVLGSEVPPA